MEEETRNFSCTSMTIKCISWLMFNGIQDSIYEPNILYNSVNVSRNLGPWIRKKKKGFQGIGKNCLASFYSLYIVTML